MSSSGRIEGGDVDDDITRGRVGKNRIIKLRKRSMDYSLLGSSDKRDGDVPMDDYSPQ